jgi:predicted nucleic acid-binding protein
MAESIVVDASPIIAWGKMGALDLVSQLPFRFISPAQVRIEVDTGTSKGYPVSFPDWIEVTDLRNRLSRLTLATLDKGEAAVIDVGPRERRD